MKNVIFYNIYTTSLTSAIIYTLLSNILNIDTFLISTVVGLTTGFIFASTIPYDKKNISNVFKWKIKK